MTGDELRQVLAVAGITPNQFVERAAKRMSAEGGTTEKNALRSAKRWLSARKSQEQLRFNARNVAIVAEVVGIEPARLLDWRASPLEVRLAELAEKLGDVLDSQMKADRNLRRLQSRVRTLETQRAGGAVEPMHPQKAAPK